MADAKISALVEKTTLHDTDLVPIVDIEATPDTTKKITGANLKTAMGKHTQNTDTDLDATFEATFGKHADKLSAFAATTSAELAGVISDETGSGALAFATSPTLVTPVLGTPTSGTLTNCTGLPVAGITASTSTALGVGSVELGHATDTSITRVSAGLVAVEGSNLIRASDVDDTPVNGETAVPVSSNWAYDHAALTTGVHGVSSSYVTLAPAASHLVRTFTKGWTSGKLLKGAGVDANPTEIGGLEVVAHTLITETTTSVTLSSLDGDNAPYYLLIVRWVNAYNGAAHLFNKLNDDGTAANYYRQYMVADGASVTSGRDQVPTGFQAGYVGAQNLVSLLVAYIAAKSGVYRIQWVAIAHGGASGVSTPTFLGNMQTWTNTADNITSMVFQGNFGGFVNSAIGAGSHFTLLKPLS